MKKLITINLDWRQAKNVLTALSREKRQLKIDRKALVHKNGTAEAEKEDRRLALDIQAIEALEEHISQEVGKK